MIKCYQYCQILENKYSSRITRRARLETFCRYACMYVWLSVPNFVINFFGYVVLWHTTYRLCLTASIDYWLNSSPFLLHWALFWEKMRAWSYVAQWLCKSLSATAKFLSSKNFYEPGILRAKQVENTKYRNGNIAKFRRWSKNEDEPKIKITLKMRMNPKVKTISKLKLTPKMKTTQN